MAGRKKTEETQASEGVEAANAVSEDEVVHNPDMKDVAGRHVNTQLVGYAAVEGSRSDRFAEILKQLSAKIPDEFVKTHPDTGASYIEWHVACDKLDEISPTWENHISKIEVVDEGLFAKLLIYGSVTVEGVTRMNVGWEFLKRKDRDGNIVDLAFGDVFSNAFSMYLKRVAALFGVGRHLYKKDRPEGQQTSATGTSHKAVSRSAAKEPARTDGKLVATLTGIKEEVSKRTGNPYTFLEVVVPGEKWPIKQLFGRDFDEYDLGLKLGLTTAPTYPTKALVTLDKSGQWTNIATYQPYEETVVSRLEPTSVVDETEIPF